MTDKKKMIRISVSIEDIKRGIRGSESQCPIALAIRRKFRTSGQSGLVLVNATEINIFGGRFGVPTTARDFINDFDAMSDVEPFTFDLIRKEEEI